MDVLTLLPADQPRRYRDLPPEEQEWRGRYFLMVYATGASEAFAWAAALNTDPDVEREARQTAMEADPAMIVDALRHRDDPVPEAAIAESWRH